MESLFVLIVIGLFVGILTGMTGASGVLILVPILSSFPAFSHLSIAIILGTSLIVDIVTSLSVSSTYYATAKNVDVKGSTWILLGAIMGTQIGSYLVISIPEIWIKGVIAFGMVAFGIQTFRKRIEKQGGKDGSSSHSTHPLLMVVWGMVVGTATGLFGAGGGLMIFIVLFHALKFPLKKAIGTSTFVMLFTAAFGVIGYAQHGNFDVHLSLVLGVSALVGGLLSSLVAYKIKEGVLVKIIGTVFIVSALAMLIAQVIIPLLKI